MFEGALKLDGMLMIGSAGANIGKTELACAIIRKFSKITPITAIKVTTIKAKDGQCPRGGDGCGVCSSLEGNFCITEETNKDGNKDTARLLAAGAGRVFWLRVMKTHLKEGLAALLETVGSDAVLVCESNSLRQIVEPGLFLMVRDQGQRVWKDSARGVKRYADAVVVSDGSGFDFDTNRIKLARGKWTMPEKATAIIMAGGDSCRMGIDKSMLPVAGRPMIETIVRQLRRCFTQIIISANEVDKYSFLSLQVVPDRVIDQGPLMGIASALAASDNEVNFVVACDIPYINLGFVREMLTEAEEADADIVVPTHKGTDEKYEPLFAVYCKSALGAINETLSLGKRKISDAFSRCRVRYIELDAPSGVLRQEPLGLWTGDWFTNINTMAEYEEFLGTLGQE
jgi:molybdopterin-guanine dinucleotide biosynthesis protein A